MSFRNDEVSLFLVVGDFELGNMGSDPSRDEKYLQVTGTLATKGV
jgi:hypothetical protein